MLDIALRRLNIPFEKAEPVLHKISDGSAAVASLLAKPFKKEKKFISAESKSEKIEEKVEKPVVQVKKDIVDSGMKNEDNGSDLTKLLAKQRNRKR